MADNQSLWYCRSVQCATLIRYALGDASHVRTEKTGRGPTFVFNDRARSKELQELWYSPDGEPIAVGDVRAFIDVGKAIRESIGAAETSPGGVWENNIERI